ncbi:MAG: DNA (cytosine-5-)-methyltransferase [Euryarchaeota archaeon]|nr:DNA (cytosine-5-)-methyltransferase [Euryarchaeota archaeon]NDB94364.1 DNA (cytosine-5-)-methyltransferase [Euryarchaeota archaeon]
MSQAQDLKPLRSQDRTSLLSGGEGGEVFSVLDTFAGIGGFSLGLERTGRFKTVAFCEMDAYCQEVLKQHWDGVPIYDYIEDVTAGRLLQDGIGRIDVITGGFPCQDVSTAGSMWFTPEGTNAPRSGLWAELARLIGEIRPRYAIMENVPNLLAGDDGRWFGRILSDLAQIGFDAEWHCIPASGIGAPHRRERVWIIAYPSEQGLEGGSEAGNDSSQRAQRGYQLFTGCSGVPWEAWKAEPSVDRVVNGLPRRVDRIKAIGNAIVPQIAEEIGRAICAVGN